ncbi:fumarate hydratase class I [Polymorphobacter multimanifer]|uniref:Fumarate hydratase class I n=3 Tax=Polymorphobacter multimanifer TaxID=1070431 RepID=A0A841L5X0_9SPHN|nr:fumarate hydratase [Polymorphobacter multimanifer]MBB6227997.1 fumarate hydratase class I [Polymorphobacter multimanifer]
MTADTIITQEDVIESVADALQFISYFHPMDYIHALGRAYEAEQGGAAKDAIAQILTNSRMCAEGHRPICQDTGIVVAFVKIGMNVRFQATLTVEQMINEGVRRAWLHPENKLRPSILADPAFTRVNTRDNTPAVTHISLVPGNTVEITVAAKGGGSENKSKFAMLNPSDSIRDWVVNTVPLMGAGWCPPGMLGIGIGGTAEKAMLMAKEALMEPIDMAELKARGPRDAVEELRIELHDAVNDLGIGAQGLGGLSTILDVKIFTAPTHAASKPIAMIPNCAATRHAHFVLDGSGPAYLDPPSLAEWPKVDWKPSPQAIPVDLDSLTPEIVRAWKPGDRLLLNGKMLTGRDAAHKRLTDMIARGEPLPVDFTNRVIYYVGPVDPVAGEVVGPAGPTTATRMDKFTETMLAQTGLIAMIGKAERGPAGIEAIARHKAAYLMAVGGAAYLVAKAIKASKVLAFEDLGMEAIYEFTVKDMPVTVAVDSAGTSVHKTGPAEWREKIAATRALEATV